MLRKISVGVKIFIGFTLVLALMVGVGVVGVSGLKGAGDNFLNFESLSSETEGLANLRITTLSAQIDAMRFINTGNAAARDSFRSKTKTTLEDINNRNEASSDETQVGRLDRLSENIKIYQNDFETIVAEKAMLDSLVAEQLDKASEHLNYQLVDIIDSSYFDENTDGIYYGSQMLGNLLSAQLWANRYLVNLDPMALEQSFANLDLYDENISLLKEVLTDVGAKLAIKLNENSYKEYRAALEEIKILAEERAEIIEKNQNEIGPQIGKLAASFQNLNSQQQNILKIRLIKDAEDRIILMVGIVGIAFVLSIVVALLIGRDVSGPVKRMTGAMKRLAQGDLDVIIPVQSRQDELGDMSNAVQIFKDNAIEVKRLNEEQLSAEAKKRAEAEKNQAIINKASDLEADVSRALGIITEMATELKCAAEGMQHTAKNSDRLSSEVTTAANESSQSVEAVASAAKELRVSIAKITGQVGEASLLSTKAVDDADNAAKLVSQLEKASSDISQVAAIITDIAEQTNLLALNATIEAARAGDAGKGFAVVANEVKTLANQTATATSEIGSSIILIQQVSQNMVGAIASVSGRIKNINDVSESVAHGVGEQRTATDEIANNIHRASSVSQNVSQNIEEVATATSDTGKAATQVLSASQKLSEQSNSLKYMLDGFLTQLRSA